MMKELEHDLCDITGFDAISFQPNRWVSDSEMVSDNLALRGIPLREKTLVIGTSAWLIAYVMTDPWQDEQDRMR